ncbi:MAG: cysteine--tRNA ligase [Thermodesulfobacteriota bacterium]
MSLSVFNTLTGRKEPFEPVEPGKVGMYVCGVTVYDMCHIGHARSLVVFDIIFRYLLSLGYQVTYVRNFTDVDDKIINRANQLGENWKELAERFIKEFYIDVDALGLLRPTVEPRATEHIAQILSLVERLIESQHAYEADGDVMFSVESFDGYGRLSGKKVDELISGARVEVDQKKRNPLDFALWKAAKPGEPSWTSPWGPGRPGWHIECSAMSMDYLGQEFDIHGGGADLAFPHHENEIAQSQGATGKPFAKYWIHNGFVNIRSEKMSKSLGNVLNIRTVLQDFHHEALRLFLLSKHYRSPLDYNDDSIREATVGLERLYSAMAALEKLLGLQGQARELPEPLTGIRERFSEAMDDDFNTPRALAVLFDGARAINTIATAKRPPRDKVPLPELLSAARDEITDVSRNILGILIEEPQAFLDDMRKRRALARGIQAEEIEARIAARAEARSKKDFATADKIREELAEKGVVLEDNPEGTTWTVKDPQVD